MSSVVSLKRGDSDIKGVWGGKKLTAAPINTVKSLQTNLQAVGVYTDKIDGDFGKNTEKALKIFQWCVRHSKNVIKNGALIANTPVSSMVINGEFKSGTQVKLNIWLVNKYTVAGDLVRIPSDKLSNIELGPSFGNIGKPVVGVTEFVISAAAFPMIKLMNDTAKKLKVIIKVNQAFRINGVKVTGAVVAPATRSQHLIGHAIDCNIVDGATWNTSKDFKKKQQTVNANKVIQAMKKAGYRWGGDFSKVDTPHFDKQLNANSLDYDVKFFLNQRQLSAGDPIEKQIIP